MQPEGSLPCSPSPTFTPVVSTFFRHIPVMFNSALSCLLLGLPGGLFDFLPTKKKTIYAFFFSPYMCHKPHASDLSWLILRIIFGEKWKSQAPRCAIFSSPPIGLLHPSLTQVSSSIHCSRTHTAYVLPLMWEPKISNHIKQHAESHKTRKWTVYAKWRALSG